MSQYLPEVAWSTLAGNVTLGASAYRYYITVNPLDPNEAGASPMTVDVNDWFIDFAGYPFLIEEVNGSVLTVYDILERGDGIISAYAPYANKLGYVYRPLNGAIILTQAQLRKLDASAADIIQPIEKGVIYNQLLQLNQTNPQTVYGGIPIFSTGLNTDFIDFNLLTEALGQEGRLKWNTEDGTLEVGLPGGNVNLQIGQEHVLRVYNEDTVTITNGRVVYASSASGNIKKVKLANNNVYEEATHVIGVATEDIASGHFGYIATIGLVRDMDTNGGSVGGQFAYLGLNGEITTTEPEAPNTKVIVGVIVRPHATEGILYVNFDVVPRLQDLSDVHRSTPSGYSVPVWNSTNGYYDLSTYYYDNHNRVDGAFRFFGGIITTNIDGTVNVSSGRGMVHTVDGVITDIPTSDTSSWISSMVEVTWDETLNLVLTDNAYNYIYYDYETGSIKATTDFYSISFHREFTVGRAYRSGNDVVARLCGTNAWAFDKRVQLFGEERFPVERAKGMMIGNPSGLYISVTSGVLWAELANRFTVDAFDSSGTDRFSYWYRNGLGDFTKVTNQSVIDNLNWDDGTGTLNDLTASRYGVHWVYMVHDSTVHVVYGRGDYTLANAQLATPPTSIPGLLSAYASFIGKIIVKKSSTSLYSVESPFTTIFNVAGTTEHSELSGLGWSGSGHTGNNYAIPNFSATGAATEIAPNTTTTRKYLSMLGDGTNGALPTWEEVTGGSGTPGGSDTYVQFNDGGTTFGGDDGLTYNKTTGALTCAGVIKGSNITTNSVSKSTYIGLYNGTSEDASTIRENVSIGYEAGKSITVASRNVFVGYQAGYSSSGSASSIFIGYKAGYSSANPGSNVFIGHTSGELNNSGNKNTFVGYNSGDQNTTGINNTFYGYRAGHANTVGNYNVYIGSNAGYFETGSNKLIIDNNDRSNESTARTNSMIYGEFNSTVNLQKIYLNASTYTKRVVKAYQALTSASTVTMNVRDGQNARITLGHNVALTLSNLEDGDEGNIVVTQDATGGRTLVISPTPKVINGGSGSIVLTGTAASTDMLSYTYTNSILYITYGKNYS